jgi:multidrug efflux pump subunit AcrA (membrane-fusion protein)
MVNELFRVAAPIVVLAAGILGFVAFGQKAEPPQKDLTDQPAQEVATVAVRRFDDAEDQIEIEFDGVVVPFRQIRVSSEIEGRITFKAQQLRAGRFVTAGTRLLEIDPEFHRLEVKRLEAEKVQAQKMVAELQDDRRKLEEELIPNAEKQVELEEEDLARVKQLVERKVATASELIPYERSRLNAQNSLDNLEKQVLQLENKIAQNEQMIVITDARLGQAKRDLKHSTLTAPIDGLIVEDHVEEGSYVQRGTELFLVEDTSQVEISSNLTMDELGWLLQSPQLSPGGTLPDTEQSAYQLPQVPVTVSYDLAGEVYHWNAHISRLAGTGVDPRSRTIPCRVTVPQPRQFTVDEESKLQTSRSPRTLMNGMFVEMRAKVVPSRPVLAVPEQAVHPGNVVWKYTENGLEIVTIEVLHRQGDEVLILAANSPLAAGDEVIASPLSIVEPGTPLSKKAQASSGEQKVAGAKP